MDHEDVVGAVKKMATAAAGATAVALLGAEAPTLAVLLAGAAAGTEPLLELLSANGRMREAIRDESLESVRVPEIARRVEALERDGVGVKVSDFVHLFNSYARAWTTAADSKKRRLLEDAFVRSFDRDMYESGLLNTLWERLERLSYGDLYLLRELIEAHARGAIAEARRRNELDKMPSLGAHHAANLLREGLVWKSGAMVDSVNPSELGARLHRLAWEQLPEPGAAPSEAKDV